MHELTSVIKCSFCGEDAKLVDRRKNGLYLMLASFVVAGSTGWYFGWVVGLMDWLILFILGLYWALRTERYIYRCRECTNVMTPK